MMSRPVPAFDVFLIFCLFLGTLAIGIPLPRSLSFLPALVGVAGALWLYARFRFIPAFDWRLGAFLASFMGLTAISVFWSYDSDYAAARVIKITGLLTAFFIVISLFRSLSFETIPYQKIIAAVSAVLVGIAGFIFFFEYIFGFPLTMLALGIDDFFTYTPIRNGFILNRSLVYLVLLCFPVLLFLHRSALSPKTRCALTSFVFVGVGLALYQAESQTAQIAAMLALAMFFYPSNRKWGRRILAAVFLFFLFAAPFLPPLIYNALSQKNFLQEGWAQEASAIHRLEVWNFIALEIQEKPIFGHGVEAARFLKSDSMMPNMKADHVLHPHNAFLQIWLETGLAGVLITAAFLIFLFWRIAFLPREEQRYALSFLTVLLCVLCIGYGLWQAWQIGMIFALTALSLTAMRTGAAKKSA